MIPRIFRPHTIMITHKLDENDEGKAIISKLEVKYVNFDAEYSMKQLKKGISSDYSAVAVIDLLDLVVEKNGVLVNEIEIYKNDIVTFNGIEFTVQKITYATNLMSGKQEIMQVYMNG